MKKFSFVLIFTLVVIFLFSSTTFAHDLGPEYAKEIEYCRSLNEKSWDTDAIDIPCLVDIAVKRKDVSICDEAGHAPGCYMSYAQRVNYPVICEELSKYSRDYYFCIKKVVTFSKLERSTKLFLFCYFGILIYFSIYLHYRTYKNSYDAHSIKLIPFLPVTIFAIYCIFGSIESIKYFGLFHGISFLLILLNYTLIGPYFLLNRSNNLPLNSNKSFIFPIIFITAIVPIAFMILKASIYYEENPLLYLSHYYSDTLETINLLFSFLGSIVVAVLFSVIMVLKYKRLGDIKKYNFFKKFAEILGIEFALLVCVPFVLFMIVGFGP
ncbi:hypothetical protein ACFL21_03535 [Patescibacteria group bacterium]